MNRRARISISITDDKPRYIFEADVVDVDGDTLTWVTKANPSWRSTTTRSDIADWELLPEAGPVSAFSDKSAADLERMKKIVWAADLVNDYCLEYLTPEGVIDIDTFNRERVGDIHRTLRELEEAVEVVAAYTKFDGGTLDQQAMFSVIVERANALTAAILDALGVSL